MVEYAFTAIINLLLLLQLAAQHDFAIHAGPGRYDDFRRGSTESLDFSRQLAQLQLDDILVHLQVMTFCAPLLNILYQKTNACYLVCLKHKLSAFARL